MSPAWELRLWLLVYVVLLGGMVGWSLYDQWSWSPSGTPEEVVRHLQWHARVMRYCLIVFAGVVLSGMTCWVYGALCRALDTAKHEESAMHQMDAQALQDLYIRLESKDDVDHDREA
jgi:hypothetical protein